ncbi:MAG TPA: hypothetical protein VHU61_11455 [Solirubrobacteraceae bacterium]|jgi:hypothetical protein|nr:hypothetical protein [Solirubrobacteraceae bacterium]
MSVVETRIRAPLMTHLPTRALRVWLPVLGLGLAFLYFRYDWSIADGYYAKPAFLLSAYLFVIMLPTLYYLSLRLLHHRGTAIGLTAVAFVIFTVPYRLCGLDSLYYYAIRPPYLQSGTFPARLEFLPGGTVGTFPYDWLFMPLLFLFGAAGVWLVRWARTRAGFAMLRSVPVLLTVAFAVICAQTFFHSGMRSPYTYLSYFQEAKADHHWYFVRDFADGRGQVEGDQWASWPIEGYFEGVAPRGNDLLMRRPFSFYVASQFGYFVNNFYCWLALNALFWLAAVFATARLVTRLTTPRVGLIAGALTLFGPGFIAFVATPAMYMQNYAAAAIALCAFEELIVRPIDDRARRYGLFAGVLALCALVYDLEPLFLVLFAYGLSRRVPWRPLLASLVGAGLLVLAYPEIVTHVLRIAIDTANSGQIGTSLTALRQLILHPHLSTWSDTLVGVVPKVLQMWLQAYFVIPAVLALFGWRLIRDRPTRVLIGGLLLAQFLIMALFYLGGTQISFTPRIMYPYFIGVYVPAGLALEAGSSWLFRTLSPRTLAGFTVGGGALAVYARRATPWVVVAAMAFLVNIDIFGHPTQYVEFFVNAPPSFLP